MTTRATWEPMARVLYTAAYEIGIQGVGPRFDDLPIVNKRMWCELAEAAAAYLKAEAQPGTVTLEELERILGAVDPWWLR